MEEIFSQSKREGLSTRGVSPLLQSLIKESIRINDGKPSKLTSRLSELYLKFAERR